MHLLMMQSVDFGELIIDIYSAWGLPGEKPDTYISGTQRPIWLERDSVLHHVIEAANYNDAMKQYYEYQGWGTYNPEESTRAN